MHLHVLHQLNPANKLRKLSFQKICPGLNTSKYHKLIQSPQFAAFLCTIQNPQKSLRITENCCKAARNSSDIFTEVSLSASCHNRWSGYPHGGESFAGNPQIRNTEPAFNVATHDFIDNHSQSFQTPISPASTCIDK